MPVIKDQHPNVLAFLDTIAYTEGTDNPKQVSNLYRAPDGSLHRGYDVIVGGSLLPTQSIQNLTPPPPQIVVTDYSHHPNKLVRLSPTLSSTAAGRYQILYKYWVIYKAQLNLPDFSPLSQDLYAVQQLREQGALSLLTQGRFEEAVAKVNDIWASLPDSPYGQHMYDISQAKAIYLLKGGEVL